MVSNKLSLKIKIELRGNIVCILEQCAQSSDLQQHASVTCQKPKQTLKRMYVSIFITTEL